MKCEICNKEYDGYFCPNCGWEEENVLDDKYLEIYLNKKQKHKEVFKEVEYYHNFFDSFIRKFKEFLREERDQSFYLKFLNDVLEIMKDKKYYFQLLVIKIFLLRNMKEEYKNEIKEAEELLKNNEISEEDKKIFENLKAKL